MKVLIKGDTHFDLTTGSFNRNEEIKVAYKAIIDYAIKNDIKCFVDLGDEFDNRVIEDYSVPAFMVGQLSRLAKNDIEVIRVRGNHDYPRSKNEQTVGTMLDELLEVSKITKKRNVVDHTFVGDLLITTVGWIYPFAAGGKNINDYIERELFSISPYSVVEGRSENNPKRWIVCAHLNPPYVKAGEHETQIKFDGPSIPAGAFENFGSKFDAVFLGHIHNSSTTHEYGDKDIPCVFPGSIINTSFGDKGERGFVVYDSDIDETEYISLDELCEIKKMIVFEYHIDTKDTESVKKELNILASGMSLSGNTWRGDNSIVKYVITINGVSPTGINTSVLKKELIDLSYSMLNVAYVRSVEFKFDEDKKVVEQHKAKALLKAVTVEDKVTEYMKLYKPPSEDVVRKVVGRIK